MNLELNFSPTISKFIKSPKEIVILIGPTGEGKTWGAIWGIIEWALDHQRRGARLPIYAAIIRDTFENIKRHTRRSIIKMAGEMIRWKDGGRQMVIPGLLECDLFGLDDLASLGKLQASEYHIKWIEEPAPMFTKGNAGIAEEVFDVCCGRGPREFGAKHRVQVSMNPADEEHWTYRRFVLDPAENMETLRIPRGENKNLPEEERERVRRSYAHRPDLLARYDRGEFGFVQIGEAVIPEYNEQAHLAKEKIDPMEVLTYRFWDGGLYPTCIFFQITPRGRMQVVDTMRGENMGMRQFIHTAIKPLISARYYKITEWQDIGDASIANREQSDSSQTAAQVINEELGTSFQKGIQGWEARKEAIKEVMTRLLDGEPMFQISPHERILHRALSGGWHYLKDMNGNILRDKPVKDIHSHPADAFGHGLAKIFPKRELHIPLHVRKFIPLAESGGY